MTARLRCTACGLRVLVRQAVGELNDALNDLWQGGAA
jgi:hypothetical protein